MKALVLGSGVDALVTAHTLARGGHQVTVLGGKSDGDSSRHVGWIPRRVIANLDLERHGLFNQWPDPWVSAPLPGGERLTLWRDVARSADEIRKLSPRDAGRWPKFCERMHAIAGVLEDLYGEPPPDPLTHTPGGLIDLARDALRLRKLGRQGMDDFLRFLPMSIADLLDAWFESDVLKAALGAQGVMHLAQGPRSGGTAYNFLHHHVGSPAGVFRQPLSNLREVLSALPGIQRLEHEAAHIDVQDGSVRSVALDGGEPLAASLVVSAADPRRTLLDLCDPGCLDPELVRTLRNIRSRGVAAEVTLTLARDPGFTVLALAPALDHLERAYDDSKYGRMSSDPYIEARHEATKEETHRAHVHVQYVPYALRDGTWDDARRDELTKLVIAKIDQAAPGFAAAVVGHAVLTPADLENTRGYPQGQPYHAQIALDQMLWMRPVPQLARYRTPIEGLYLCGPAMHPGIPGATGANAASVILRDLKKRK
jgi:phytoene dehydrogenase-like protein